MEHDNYLSQIEARTDERYHREAQRTHWKALIWLGLVAIVINGLSPVIVALIERS